MHVMLLHLSPDDGAHMAKSIREDGHVVTLRHGEAGEGATPDLLVVCLDSHAHRALECAGGLGGKLGLAAAQFLFVGGTPAAMSEAQRRFPTASFTRRDALATALASMDG
jgi:hypothetical protein